ncbi:Ger(x)C family spore germination protein [Cohnella sp. GCM10012308]|uniref:Ger(x)C family spore germination protein n=1 Tax=Cohnella sp. GCM10012308 TaxID=3317329 RepID=UPI00362097BA
MRGRRILIRMLPLVLLCGCQDEKVLEKIGFVRTIVMETAEGQDQAMKMTISIPKTNQTEAIVYSTVSKSFKQARIRFDMENDRKIVFGQLRQVMFGESLARRGVWGPLESVVRDPAIGVRTHILVSEGDVSRYISKRFLQGGTMGEYIDNLVRSDPATRGRFDTNLHTFMRDYYDDGIDPIATIIKETERGLGVNGIALFAGDRCVGKIDAEDAMFFALLRDKLKSGTLYMDEVETPRGMGTLTLGNVTSRQRIEVLSPPDAKLGKAARAVIKLKIRGSLLEYDGLMSLNNIRSQPMLERAMEKYVSGRCERLVKDMQRTGSDALGVGIRVRNKMKYKAWKSLDWNKAFAEAEIKVSVKLEIKDFGRLLES